MVKTDSERANKDEKIYEVGYHLLSSIAEENIPAEVEKIKAILAAEKATVVSEEAPKLRPLAYDIKKSFGGVYKKFDKAYFGWVKFELPEGVEVKSIDDKLKADENILRFILIRTARENTLYAPKLSVFRSEGKLRAPKSTPEKSEEKPASIEEIDQSIDKFVKEEVGA